MQNSARERLTIQVRTETRGAAGITVTWLETGVVWGLIAPLSSAARANLGALQGSATHMAMLREVVFTPEFGKHRVAANGKFYGFLEPPIKRGRNVTGTVSEVAP